MFFKFTLLVIGIILSGILTVVALIFGVVGLGNQKRSSRYWFIAMVLGLSLLGYCLHTLTYKVQQKVTHLVQDVEDGFKNQLEKLDTNLIHEYHQSGTHQNGVIDTLKGYVSEGVSVPESFYTYLGFRDYYRLPVAYPFSIHCIDELKNGQLFNEKFVSEFDRNDNGEIALPLTNIQSFVGDASFLLAETYTGKSRVFILYHLTTDQKQEFSTKAELMSVAIKRGYRGNSNWKTCEQYFESLTVK